MVSAPMMLTLRACDCVGLYRVANFCNCYTMSLMNIKIWYDGITPLKCSCTRFTHIEYY